MWLRLNPCKMKFFQILLVLVSPLLVSSSDFNNNQSNHLSGNETESLEHRETSEFGPEIARLCNQMISPDHNMTTNEFLDEMIEYLSTEIEEECDSEYVSDEEFETTIVPLSEDRALSLVPIATPSGGQNSNLGQQVYENRQTSEFGIEFNSFMPPNDFPLITMTLNWLMNSSLKWLKLSTLTSKMKPILNFVLVIISRFYL